MLNLFTDPCFYLWNKYETRETSNIYTEYLLLDGEPSRDHSVPPVGRWRKIDPKNNRYLLIENKNGIPQHQVKRNEGKYWVNLRVGMDINLGKVEHRWTSMQSIEQHEQFSEYFDDL